MKHSQKEHKEDSYKIYSRTQLGSILPGISLEIARKKPDIILLGEKNLIIVENKTGAGLKEKQLSNYSTALCFDKNRKGSLLVIAPKSTRYVSHGHDIEMISCDQIYYLIEKNIDLVKTEKRENILAILGRLRFEYFQNIFDDVISKLSISIKYSVSYAGQDPKDFYYAKHIILPEYPNITYSRAIFIKAPSYLLVNPYKIIIHGKKYNIDEGLPIVKIFKEKMRKLSGTSHELLESMPGYMIDLLPGNYNSSEVIADEIKSILMNKSLELQNIISNT